VCPQCDHCRLIVIERRLREAEARRALEQRIMELEEADEDDRRRLR
jgi:hypothetical protein